MMHSKLVVAAALLAVAAVAQNASGPITQAPGSFARNGTMWEVRLAGVTNNTATNVSGRIEVRPNSTAAWGTICNSGWDNSDAQRACRSLGFSASGARAPTGGFPMAANGTMVYLSSVSCSGTDSVVFLHQCSNSTSPSSSCNARTNGYGDAGVTCRKILNAALTTPRTDAGATWQYRLGLTWQNATTTTGLLEVRPNASALWGTVCDDAFGNWDASRACAALGLPTANSIARFALGGALGPIYMDDVACTAGNTSQMYLDQCRYTNQFRENCGHSEDVGVTCSSIGGTPPPPTPTLTPSSYTSCTTCVASGNYWCKDDSSCSSSSLCGSGCILLSRCAGRTGVVCGSGSSTTTPSYTWSATHGTGSTRSVFSSSAYSSAVRSPTGVSTSCGLTYPTKVRSGTRWVVTFRFTTSNYVTCNSGLWSAYSSTTRRASLSASFVTQGYGTLVTFSRTSYAWTGLAVAAAALGVAILAVIIIGVVCCFCITGLIIYCACCKKDTTVVVASQPTPMNQPYQGA